MSQSVRALPIVLALATGAFAIGTTEFATMSLLPFIRASFELDPATAGHVISIYALGVVFGAPVITVLGARMARKPLLLILMSLFGLGNALSALAPGYISLLSVRFLTGVPHGAFFGLASLVAASAVAPARRTQAVGYVMLGLTAASVIGVPLATWLGQSLGWRAGYWAIALIALLAVTLIAIYAPNDRPRFSASPLRELGALSRSAVWLTLAIGAVGFGGMFAVYTYLTSTLDEVTDMAPAHMPWILGIFGLGMTAGNLLLPRLADRALMPSAGGVLAWSAIALALFPVASQWPWAIAVNVFCIGIGGGLGPILQTRLMDVAGDAQNLAAALNHVAFNVANALGPWLAGLALAAGYGLTSSGVVGSLLALGGLLIWLLALYQMRTTRTARG